MHSSASTDAQSSRQITAFVVAADGERSGCVPDWIKAVPEVQFVGTAASLTLAREELTNIAPDMVLLQNSYGGAVLRQQIASLSAFLPGTGIISIGSEAHIDLRPNDDERILYVCKPPDGEDMQGFRDELYTCMTSMAGDIRHAEKDVNMRPKRDRRKIEAIMVAASTGGPDALDIFLKLLIAHDISVPILIVQHIPAQYSSMLADKLRRRLLRPCEEGRQNMPIENNKIYLAPGNLHMRLRRSDGDDAQISLEDTPPIDHCRPSADILFASGARTFGDKALGVVMTGMGSDGKAGARDIADVGGRILAQDRLSSAVWGMPGAVIGAGLADYVGNPKNLALHAINVVRGDM